MAGLLTPTAIWKNFKIEGDVTAKILSEQSNEEFIVTELMIQGRKVGDENVQIYAKLTRLTRTKHAPVVIIALDVFDGTNIELAEKLARKGFVCLTVDYAGELENKEKFTIYPSKIDYANVKNVNLDSFEIKTDYISSNWYEWDCVFKYAYAYVKAQEYTTGVGFFGINDGATVTMHVISTEQDVCASVMCGGSGWQAYKGIDKYGDTPEPHFNDDTLKYIASVESESYSRGVKCPLLLLCPTNSAKYDSDRAYDTISRIEENVYTAFNLSPSRRDSVDYQSYFNAETFLSKFLLTKNSKTVLPNELVTKAEIVDKEIMAIVTPDQNNLKEVEVYFSEEISDPSVRSWKKFSEPKYTDNGNLYFDYRPYGKSGKVFYFAKAIYKNHFSVCSPISVIKFTEDQVVFNNKSQILYSSRIVDADSVFAPCIENEISPIGISLDEEDVVFVKELEDETFGVGAKNGLYTFRIGANKYRPNEYSILMFDIYADRASTIKIGVHTKHKNVKQSYYNTIKVFEKVWQNVKLYKNGFKNANGATIKDASHLIALSIEVSGEEKCEFLINNALWV